MNSYQKYNKERQKRKYTFNDTVIHNNTIGTIFCIGENESKTEYLYSLHLENGESVFNIEESKLISYPKHNKGKYGLKHG